jgi:hypothetical protein
MYPLDHTTMLNRVTINKLGVIIVRVSEYFRRDRAPVPLIESRRAGVKNRSGP